MSDTDLADRLIAAWQRRDEINPTPIAALPAARAKLRLPESVAMQGLWGRWFSGK